MFFLFLLALWIMFALFGSWIASAKGRSSLEGFVIGFLFGPLGCLIEALLPTLAYATPSPFHAVTITPEQAAEAEQEEERRRKYQFDRDMLIAERQAKLDAQRDAALELARKQADETRRQAWAWFNRVVIRFGWFRALPETAQPIVVGLAVALPVICVIVILFQPVKPEPSNETRSAPAPQIEQVDSDPPPPF
ncbi:hypothetical protein [Singulisphaera acidiphila]|uniref:Uncharacterized protein n=1 Tax=Singulisphaera acidiphila (strain ATCC BAA-1392 / DSM 18658 / VKM B-2454 / MOB10) TaxID=886293 RepID=L0DEG0_SINAD|nr:hypothetical protein [Singulisphaera acidiphila]AGA27642.1 hypothetical protein Sinac_3380 [Singulisphaera acidiphila DSM 18658]